MKLILTVTIVLLNIWMVKGQHDSEFIKSHSGIHRVIVSEVLQTKSYTYLLVKDADKLQWLAVPKIDAKVGEVYFYQGGNEMKDFKSSSLNRTFESVLFLGGIVNADPNNDQQPDSSISIKSKPGGTKIDLSLKPSADGISIAELYAEKENYSGKIVRIRGQVTQFSSSIMGKNWIHIQDGTEFEGVFDLVATSDEVINEGEIAVFEGKIILDKDFGFGYFYKVIMEDAQITVEQD